MGYQVTITRQDKETSISKKEWLDYVASDSELTVKEENLFPIVLYLSEETEFHWEESGVWAWTPSNTIILKMLKIAGKLNAKVLGEDDTIFILGNNGKICEIKPKDEEDELKNLENKSWWQRLLGL